MIFIRHPATVSAVMGDCSTQRTLSQAGWRRARAIGKAFAELQIPVGEVYSSEYCRAWQTADLAFGRHRKTPDLNFEPAEDYSEEQIAAMRARMTPHLAAKPRDGLNTVPVGHDDPFEAATGIYPEPMKITLPPPCELASSSAPLSRSAKAASWPVLVALCQSMRPADRTAGQRGRQTAALRCASSDSVRKRSEPGRRVAPGRSAGRSTTAAAVTASRRGPSA